jgi:hypothetical protein
VVLQLFVRAALPMANRFLRKMMVANIYTIATLDFLSIESPKLQSNCRSSQFMSVFWRFVDLKEIWRGKREKVLTALGVGVEKSSRSDRIMSDGLSPIAQSGNFQARMV